MADSSVLNLAILLFPGVEALDYQGPVSLLGFISTDSEIQLPQMPEYRFTITYLAPSQDPVKPVSGPLVHPDKTYDDILVDLENGEDVPLDALLVPGGPGASPGVLSEKALDLVQKLAQHIRGRNGYILSVCTGAWILARAGILNEKCATTNKAKFELIKGDTSSSIKWVSHARWVDQDDKHLWTSSGVTAGADMAAAFLEHLVGPVITRFVRGTIELSYKCKDQDEFADFWHLEYAPSPCT